VEIFKFQRPDFKKRWKPRVVNYFIQKSKKEAFDPYLGYGSNQNKAF